MLPTIFIGIDPGKKGAIAINNNGEMSVFDMPLKEHTEKPEIDAKKLFKLLKSATTSDMKVFAAIEEQQAMTMFNAKTKQIMPQGAVSNFSTGYGYGLLIMALESIGISYLKVRPKEWQKLFLMSKGKKADIKEQTASIAANLFPEVQLKTKRGRLLDGRSDAILICQWAKSRYNIMHGVVQDAKTSVNQKLHESQKRRVAIHRRTKRNNG